MDEKLYFLFLGFCMLFQSCESPLDPVTPRNRYGDVALTKSDLIPGHLDQIDVFENQRIWNPSDIDTTIKVDTTAASFSIWYDSRLIGSSGLPPSTAHLSSFAWHIDSVHLDQSGQTLVDFSQSRQWIAFTISSSHDSGMTFSHDTLTMNPATGQATILFVENRGQRQVTANLSAHLARYRLTVTGTFVFTY